MREPGIVIVALALAAPGRAQHPASLMADLTQPQDYVLKRVSSYDRSGGNADRRTIAAGETLTVFEESGPGVVTHIWFAIASPEEAHLKKLVLRMYWDNEPTPSVEAPALSRLPAGPSRRRCQ